LKIPAARTFGSATATSSASVQGSIRGRIGVAWDRALIYGTLGPSRAEREAHDEFGVFDRKHG
jgi:hypothetical protein